MRRTAAIAFALAAALLAVPAPAVAVDEYALPPEACTETGDSAAAIEAFLATVPNGAVLTFPPQARCRVERTVHLDVPPDGEPVRAETVVELRGATIFRDQEPFCEEGERDGCNGPIVSLNLVEGVILQHGEIRGGLLVEGAPTYDPTYEHDHGVSVHGSRGVTLLSLTIGNVGGDCVDIDKQDRDEAVRISIIGTDGAPFVCEAAGRQGISANAATDLRVQGVTLDRIAASGIDLEPRRSGYIDTALLEDNRFGWITNYAIAGIGAGQTWKDVTVRGNVQTDPDHPGLGFLRTGNSFDRGPLVMTGNRMLNRVQLNHTSGGASDNVLLPPADVECMFELFNEPPFEVAGNEHPRRVEEVCAFSGPIKDPTREQLKQLRRFALPLLIGGAAVVALAVAGGVLFVRRRRLARAGRA
jgi:hypothetical protein